MVARGTLAVGERFVHESIIGTRFTARAVQENVIGGMKAVIPEVTGSAYVTGVSTLMIDPDDPLPEGFLLGRD